MRKKILLSALFALVCTISTLAQSSKISLSGTVYDAFEKPISGVTVSVKGKKQGTHTDPQGKFQVQSAKGDILLFSFMGYESQEIQANEDKPDLKIIMQTSSTLLDEMVIVGYGTQSRRTITSSIAKVSGDVIQNIPITTASEGLKGKIAGVRVFSNNNTPGAEASLIIRGGSSITQSNSPLVLVDGIERGFNAVNPNDIESIEVLKDAASTAIYGARASNGVVLITTKGGKKNAAPRITFDVNLATQDVASKMSLMNARDFINTVRPIVANSPLYSDRNQTSGFATSSGNSENSIYSTRYLGAGEAIPEGYQSMADPLDPTKTLIFQESKMQDLLFNPAIWQNYYVSVDGGGDKTVYRGSIGYVEDKGVALGTGFKRFDAKSNARIEISPKLSTSLGFDLSRTTSNQFASQTNEISRALANAPTLRLYNKDGIPNRGFNVATPNPLWTDYYKDRADKRYNTIAYADLTYHIIDGLKAYVNGSYFYTQYQFDSFEKANEFNKLRPATSDFNDLERIKLDTYLNYTKSFNTKHNLSVMAGYTYQKSDRKYLDAAADGGSSDKIPTLGVAPNKKKADTKLEQIVLLGYFGRLNYDYDKKYLLSATFRQDGSSLFAKQNRWGFFPGISGGWVMSEEDFMKGLSPALSNLKWRFSYGQTGNNNVGLYDALGGYSPTQQYNGVAGISPSVMPSFDLTWETTTQLDLGFDLGLFKNRVNLLFDYFNKDTRDLIYQQPLPNTAMFNSVYTNIGKVNFHGFDIDLRTNNIETKDFSWTSSITVSFIKNKVISLKDNGRDRNRQGGITLPDGTAFGGIAEGEPLYRYYGFKVDRILQNEQEASNAHYDASANGWIKENGAWVKKAGRKSAGDYEWMDRDGDGRIDNNDQYELGVTVPHTTGGFSNNFRYKNFSLNIALDWAIGHYIQDDNYMRFFMNTFDFTHALTTDAATGWKAEGDQTKYARIVGDDANVGNRNYTRKSDVFNYKGDYLCLRDFSLQYQVPKRWISKAGVEGLTLTASGNNLYYFTAVKSGISPEIGTGSTFDANYNSYPPIRKFSFGVKATF
ncbi:SusC/RagA family TonB-linked outer membrane protein [Sphingobacterium sp. SYP-B4668]|uniref:SusC/RagA family TonB-linked outer membrane protein n=1 Tax=Sphingobacterium sp. SYP-B4668 TaxID=2996035 RepID=UPI0022DD7A40|nr:TonB-dependent receptor [Sphingobacterium sp. SYP-B4668]